MLAVATVYAGWKAGDWMDAYYGDSQVIWIWRMTSRHYRVLTVGKTGLFESILFSHAQLWIEEGIEGMAA